jgi:HEAT repeat protein
MKTINTTLITFLTLVLLSVAGLEAQVEHYNNITPNAIKTLKAGIQSDNNGLRRSSIYMAGFYKIDDAVQVLINELQKEKDPSTEVLIALSLYNIGNPEGIEAIKTLSESNGDTKVKRISNAIYKAYEENSDLVTQK